nr:MAG TPA: hypothetical protein [Caudoviricetes sp.]
MDAAPAAARPAVTVPMATPATFSPVFAAPPNLDSPD